MSFSTRSLLVASFLSLGAQAMAATLPPQAIACQSFKDAQNYQLFAKQQPNFAADLLNRARCFQTTGQEEAVKINKTDKFNQYQLLTGHLVWVRQ